MKDLWGYIRDKFPPARAVAFLTPIALPLLAYLNTWIADHAPWIDQYVSQGEREGIFISTIVAGVALAYKWLDGRSKWELGQIQAHVGLAQANIKPSELPPGVLDSPALPSTTEPDGAMILSQPDDIAESDSDPPEFEERRERDELGGRE